MVLSRRDDFNTFFDNVVMFVHDLKEYEQDFDNRLKHGELTNPDSIHFADSLKFNGLWE